MVRWKGTSALALLALSVAAGFWVGSLLAAGLSTARAERGACTAWPGEPSPLPHVDHPDPFLARWARLRVAELGRTAFDLEDIDPRAARESWEHIRCLDPSGELARLGREGTELRTTEMADTPPVSARPVLPAPDWSPIDAKLGETEALVRGARFEQALRAADQIRPALASTEGAPGGGIRRAQLEVLSATAQIALGRHQAARECFVRALAADPELQLDAGSTSPKIRRVFETVRSESGIPGP